MATVGEFVVERLYGWGINKVYGYPGDGINGIFNGLRKKRDEVQLISAKHEEEAAFMATAHAKFTGEVGVCMATSGPGAIHLLNGLYDAKKDNMPVVAIVGQQATTAMGSDYQQEVDLISLYKDVADEYVHMCHTASQARQLVDESVRISKANNTVTCIIFPNDIQDEEMVDPPRKHGTTFSGIGYEQPQLVPHDHQLKEAANILNEGERVAILIGAGARNASNEVRAVADRLGAGVAKALLGKDVIADNLPYVTGAIGLLGTKPSWDLMQKCDTLLMIGTSFPYAEFLPEQGQAKAVQIDIQARKLGLRYPTDVNLHGGAKLTLQRLMMLINRKKDQLWREYIEEEVNLWWEVVEERAYKSADPINPQLIFSKLSSKLPSNSIITCDSGSAANWYARNLIFRKGMRGSLSGGLATMCPAVPYATAAKLNYPDRPVIATVGDGAMQMLGNSSLLTVAEHYKNWINPTYVVLVLNNQDLNQVTWEQRVMEGDPEFSVSQQIPDFDFAGYADLIGLKGITVDDPDQIDEALDEAFNFDKPVVINAYVDPDVPPLPPHIDMSQMKAHANAMFKGDPDAWGTIVQSFKQKGVEYKEQFKDLLD